MRLDSETSAMQLHVILKRVCLVPQDHSQVLGWTFRGNLFCQLICNENKKKRLELAIENLGKDFSDVVWTDECSVQLSSHRRFCCPKKNERLKNKPR